MFCPECGKEIPEGTSFCPKCGKGIPKGTTFCPDCGREIPEGTAFCPKCGYNFSYVPPEQRQPYPKRKEVFLISFLAGLLIGAILNMFVSFFFFFIMIPFIFTRQRSSSPFFYVLSGAFTGLCIGTVVVLILKALNIV